MILYDKVRNTVKGSPGVLKDSGRIFNVLQGFFEPDPGRKIRRVHLRIRRL